MKSAWKKLFSISDAIFLKSKNWIYHYNSGLLRLLTKGFVEASDFFRVPIRQNFSFRGKFWQNRGRISTEQ